MINVGVLGYGTVGSGVVELLDKNKDIIRKRTKEEINVKYILDIKDFKGDKYEYKIIKDFNLILNDKEISTVAELIGGVTIAYEYTKKLLEAGKNVVTSNKELVSVKGEELLKIARKNNVKYLFEASVGGGIPVIHPLLQCLTANKINKIIGIMNGTTNYILTKMIQYKIDFKEALKNAQKLGYAEGNPDADILGYDACRKICILSDLAYGININPDLVHVEGIDNLSLEDIENADRLGYVVKLIGYSKKISDKEIEIFVAPCALKKTHPLANVEDVFNAILVNGDATDEVMFYGKGAGKFPTASAVCSDIIECLNKNNIEIMWNSEEISIKKPKLDKIDGMKFEIIN